MEIGRGAVIYKLGFESDYINIEGVKVLRYKETWVRILWQRDGLLPIILYENGRQLVLHGVPPDTVTVRRERLLTHGKKINRGKVKGRRTKILPKYRRTSKIFPLFFFPSIVLMSYILLPSLVEASSIVLIGTLASTSSRRDT
ncbi:hypothetical protein G7Y89_g15258 [Cudoniella acicularis]|uniref:Uncharacterized protein n=1 Tax=Cudoniella acicularis TaxID=354080 RepID=A0A8H4QRG6_9HELO|nr:hypothetical protein G7Y89_g15258 [Cudoniella acicularis]